jgi:hypothetical protein
VNRFFQELQTQRWDDHRYYHHSRINQSLHLLSALSFVTAYALLLVDPAWSALLAWTVSMTSPNRRGNWSRWSASMRRRACLASST